MKKIKANGPGNIIVEVPEGTTGFFRAKYYQECSDNSLFGNWTGDFYADPEQNGLILRVVDGKAIEVQCHYEFAMTPNYERVREIKVVKCQT